MKRFTVLAVLFVSLIFNSCNDSDACNELCFTPPDTFVFELVDSETRENLFTNGTFSRAGIVVRHTESQETESFIFYDQDDLNLLVLSTIGWRTEILELDVTVGDMEAFSIYVDSERVEDSCCAHTIFNEVEIYNATYEYDSNNNIYTILIDL